MSKKDKRWKKAARKGLSASLIRKLLTALEGMSTGHLFSERDFQIAQGVHFHRLSPKARPIVIYLAEQVKYECDATEDGTCTDENIAELKEVARHFLSVLEEK